MDAQAVQALVRDGKQPDQDPSERKKPVQPKKSSEAPPPLQGFIAMKVLPRTPMMMRLTTSFARNLCVMGNMGIPNGFNAQWKRYHADLARETKAKSVFEGGARSTIRKVIAKDGVAMDAALSKIYTERFPTEGVGLHDCWEDRFHRHWMGVMLAIVHPVTWKPLFLGVGLDRLSKRIPDGATLNSTANLTDTFQAVWRGRFGRDAVMPPFIGSDNCPAAVGVASALNRPPFRASEHALYIIVRRVCFDGLGKEKYPRPVPETVADPVLLKALDSLRATAVALKSDTVCSQWCGQGLGGAQHAVPHIDSPCHWGSTLEFISTSLRLKSDFEQLQAALGENVVPLPDNAGWCRLRDAVPSLDVVEMGMAVLGCTSARASQILPVLYHANERLLAIDGSHAEKELGKLFARELDGTIERNLKTHFPASLSNGSAGPLFKAFHASGIQNPFHALQVAALLAVGPSPGFKLDDTDTRSRLEKFCCVCLEQAGTFRQKALSSQVDGAGPSPSKRRRLLRMNSFMAALDKPVEHSEIDKNLSDPRQQVRNAVRNFLGRESFPGAKSGDALCSWWAAHQEDYKDLVPGVRSILGWPAGNPDVERLFGKSSETLTLFRKQNPLHVVLLRQNAIKLGLFG